MCSRLFVRKSWSWSLFFSLEAKFQRTMTIRAASLLWGDLSHGHWLFLAQHSPCVSLHTSFFPAGPPSVTSLGNHRPKRSRDHSCKYLRSRAKGDNHLRIFPESTLRAQSAKDCKHFQDLPPGLNFSIENEISKRAGHQGPFFVGNSEGQDFDTFNQESTQQTKPKKVAKRKVHELRPFFCEFWCVFPWEKSTIHIELLFRNAPAKSSWTGFLWFGLPGWFLIQASLKFSSAIETFKSDRFFWQDSGP